MRRIYWHKLNHDYVAVNDQGQLVGFLPEIKRPPIRPPKPPSGQVATIYLPKQ